MHLWPWNSIANRILLRWRFAESLVNWNGTIQTLEHLQTNKQTDTETDADEISTASLRGGNNVFTLKHLSCMSLHAINVFDKVYKINEALKKCTLKAPL